MDQEEDKVLREDMEDQVTKDPMVTKDVKEQKVQEEKMVM